MSAPRRIADKIVDAREARAWIADREARGDRVARAHGVFDVVGVEHLRYLLETLGAARRLVVWLEDDAGSTPLLDARERATLVAALACVDRVVLPGPGAAGAASGPAAPSSARIRRRVLAAHGKS